MAVKWIGDVARELGIDVFDAVEFLAGKQNYPMNGLLDEERVQFLKLGKGNAARVESTNPAPVPPQPQDEKPGKRGKGAEKAVAKEPEKEPEQKENVTAPIAVAGKDKAEERTVIIQNPMQAAQQGGPGGPGQ